MRILQSTTGSFNADPFNTTVLVANPYIPIYVNHTSTIKGNIEYYSKPSLKEDYLKKPNTLKSIKEGLEMALKARRIFIGGRFFFFIKGAMYTEEGVPLMVLTMPQNKFKDPTVKKFSDLRYGKEVPGLNYRDFILFYSTSFFTNPNLAALNRRLQKEILMSCYEKGIEVRVITSSEIERNTFANILEVPQAKSVSQLEEYMNTVLPNYLHTEEEDTFVFKELVPQVQEELSVEEEALLFDSESVIENVVNSNTSNLYFETEEEIELLPIFRDPEREEMEREAATWDSAHTESAYVAPDNTSHSELPVFQTSTGEQIVTSNTSRSFRGFIELIDDTE